MPSRRPTAIRSTIPCRITIRSGPMPTGIRAFTAPYSITGGCLPCRQRRSDVHLRHLGRRTRRGRRHQQFDDQLLHPASTSIWGGTATTSRSRPCPSRSSSSAGLRCASRSPRRQPESGPTTEPLRLTPPSRPSPICEAAPPTTGCRASGATADPYLDEQPPRAPRSSRARTQRTPHRTLASRGSVSRPAPLGDGRHRTERLGEQAGHLRRADQPRRGRKAATNHYGCPSPYTEMIRMEKMVQNEGWSNWE